MNIKRDYMGKPAGRVDLDYEEDIFPLMEEEEEFTERDAEGRVVGRKLRKEDYDIRKNDESKE